uniref:Uncharacterized protein n=1 Tax=Euplotes crassus TaxID=5936 RepID=A0A7S3K964_EUPCR|mmetsp:Transcript_16047/g.15769  ORF Transcript_16047/g.15769 Transcript_16047/m.15769 type:complete len:130 (+) Transcript_16047:600-989(+)
MRMTTLLILKNILSSRSRMGSKIWPLNKIIEARRRKDNKSADPTSIQYKPYSLNDYKRNYSVSDPKPLGGLGPNPHNPDWKKKFKDREKMINFAKEAEFSNKLRLVHLKKTSQRGVTTKKFGVNGPKYN